MLNVVILIRKSSRFSKNNLYFALMMPVSKRKKVSKAMKSKSHTSFG